MQYAGSRQQSTPVFWPGESHGQRSLAGYSPRGRKELDTTEWLHSLTQHNAADCFNLTEVCIVEKVWVSSAMLTQRRMKTYVIGLLPWPWSPGGVLTSHPRSMNSNVFLHNTKRPLIVLKVFNSLIPDPSTGVLDSSGCYIAKHHRLGGLSNRNLFLTVL